jgi:hypothetical protein
MKLICIILGLFLLLQSSSCKPKQSPPPATQYPPEQIIDNNITDEPEQPPVHQEVEIEPSGDVDMEDDINEDDNETYEPDINLPQTASQRMTELMQDYHYIRNSGKLKRKKLARQLNKDGFRKSDGSKFRRRDIPKYPN